MAAFLVRAACISVSRHGMMFVQQREMGQDSPGFCHLLPTAAPAMGR
jgi:hypothetical protein